MTKQVRAVAGLMLALFFALFVNLNIVQVLRADELANHPANSRLIVAEYQRQRGPIVVGQQQVAFSVPTDDELKYLRRYDPPTLYSHILGYYSFVLVRDGLEAEMNEALVGTSTNLLAENLAELLGDRDPVGDTVRLTIDPAVQQAARSALGNRTGAVVALDPKMGAVLAHVSSPDYDPNRLSSHESKQIQAYWDALQADPREPLADRAIERRFQPGSTMKLIVAAAALERGLTPDTAFPDAVSYTPPLTSMPIRNYGGGSCGGGGSITLARSLVTSCNTVFARLGVQLGTDALVAQAERFGFNRRPPYTLPATASVIPKELDPPSTAQSAIGARDVQATAMQMAMVAAAIVNKGVLMRPYVVAEVLDPSGRRVKGPDSGPWVEGAFTAQAVSEGTAATLADLMVKVVQEGTGTRAQIPGVVVGGKTGTADPGEEVSPHVWFVGFAATPGPRAGPPLPRVAVAVVLPTAGQGVTGGRDAAPIAKAVMQAAVGPQ